MDARIAVRVLGFGDLETRRSKLKVFAISLTPEPRSRLRPYFLTGAVLEAASNRRMTSAVRSRPVSAQTAPESVMSITMCRPFSVATCSRTGFSLSWNSCLQLVLELLPFGLGVLLEELNVAIHLLDVLLELRRA